jgi:hypothetical protein
MANIVRYPKELVVGSTTDYIEFKTIRRDYEGTSPGGSAGRARGVSTGIFGRMTGYKDEPMQAAGKVLLPIPQKIAEANTQSYNSMALGPEVEAALTGGTMGFGFEGNKLDLADIAIRIAENTTLDFTTENLNKLGGTNLSRNAVLSATSGVIYNPMMEVLYDGPQFRRFNYQFLLFAKSEEDAKNIYSIVRFFQQASVPSSSGTTSKDGVASAILNATAANSISGVASTLSGASKQALNDGVKKALDPKGTTGGIGGIAQSFFGSIAGGALNTILGSAGGLAGAGAVNAGFIFSGEDRFIKNPPHLLVTYKRGSDDHPYILPPQPCIIENIQIDYTPGGNYTMLNNFASKGQATTVSTLITLTLTETKITYQDYYQ